MASLSRNNTVIGILLIVLGLILFGGQLLPGVFGSVTLLVIGIAFVAAYFYTRAYGLLIPGGILVGLGVGDLLGALSGLVPLLHVDLGAAGLGFGFILIYLIDRTVRGQTHWWPLVPGGILLVVGLLQGLWDLQRIVLPLAIVGVGVWLLASAMGWTRRGPA
jgi:hypothetical protein